MPFRPSFRAGLLCASALFSVLGAASGADVRVQQARNGADKEVEARRILRLSNGHAITALSRWRDGAWEFLGKQSWRALEPGQVVGVAREAEALAEWQARVNAADLADVQECLRLADWAATNGLAERALEQLDGVLARDPDQAGALRILRGPGLVVLPSRAVPREMLAEARVELVRFGGAQPSLAAREAVLAELGRMPALEELRALMVREVASRNPARRSFAVHGLRRLFPGTELRLHLQRCVADAAHEVRLEAARALRRAQEPALVLPIARSLLDGRSPELRANAAETLGWMGYGAAVEFLIARLRCADAVGPGTLARTPSSQVYVPEALAFVIDFDVEASQSAAALDPEVNVRTPGQPIEAAASGAAIEDRRTETAAVLRALETLVEPAPRRSTRAWIEWWSENRARWRASELTRPPHRAELPPN